MHARKRQPAPYKPAIGTARDKGVVVSESRFRWKEKHERAHEMTIRLVRFVWMRDPFVWADRNRLHAHWLGVALRQGYLAAAYPSHKGPQIKVTASGLRLLHADRRSA
jgi:hypothetical protein